MKKYRVLLLGLWLLVIAIAVMIFLFSAMEGPTSMKTSDGLTYWLIRLTHPGYDALTAKEKRIIYSQYVVYVRKVAHFTEFAMLGASLRMLFQALRLRHPVVCAWLAGTLYACTDELHQHFVGTRSAMIQDVGIDSCGVLAGVLLISLILYVRRRKKKTQESKFS